MLATVVVAMGCGTGDDTSGDDRPAAPAGCAGYTASGPPGVDGCHDSKVCYFDEEANEWKVIYCDPPPPTDPCTLCTTDEICVQSYGGACGDGVAHCVAKTVECPNNACTEDCQTAYCGTSLYQCMTRVPCGTESPLAFTCYGP